MWRHWDNARSSQLEDEADGGETRVKELWESSLRRRSVMEISAAALLSQKNQQREHTMGDLATPQCLAALGIIRPVPHFNAVFSQAASNPVAFFQENLSESSARLQSCQSAFWITRSSSIDVGVGWGGPQEADKWASFPPSPTEKTVNVCRFHHGVTRLTSSEQNGSCMEMQTLSGVMTVLLR